MDVHARTVELFGSTPRRMLIFALAPLALDAMLYAFCLRSGLDPLSAALVAKTALIGALFVGLAGGFLTFLAQGRSDLPAAWETTMRILLASAFVGLLAVVLGTGFLLVAAVAARHAAATLAVALVLTFVAGVLAYMRGFAARAFALRGRLALPAALAQGAALALLAFAPSPAAVALAASCAAGLVLAPFLLLTKRRPDRHG